MKMPDYLKPYTGQALKILKIVNPKFNELDINKNIHEVQKIAVNLNENKNNDRTSFPEFDFFPGLSFTAEKRINSITPEIKDTRKELFGKSKAPFNYDDAIEWIKKEAQKEKIEFYKKNQISGTDIQKLKNKIYNLIDALNNIQQWDYGMLSKLITIPIILKNGLRDEIITFPGTKLRKLANAINLYSENTNFSKFSLLIFILTGIEPTLFSYSIVKEDSSNIGKKIELKIFRPFSQREFLKLFKYVGKFMPREKKIKEKSRRIYNFIKERGPLPSNGKMKFWEESLQQWNNTYPEEKYAGESGLRMAYLRIINKIESL
ncbi:MAG: hypothetical protein ACOC56_03890 [Atribacterota bacterium]